MESVQRAMHSISWAGASSLSFDFPFPLVLALGVDAVSTGVCPSTAEPEVGAIADGLSGAWYSVRGSGTGGGAGVGNRNVPFGRGRALGLECEGMGGWENMCGRSWVRCRWRVWARENGRTKLGGVVSDELRIRRGLYTYLSARLNKAS
jgi:hypothetical protein